MKLKEVLKETLDFENDTLNSDSIEKIKEYILKCDEFKDADELEVIKIPDIEDKSGKLFNSNSYMLLDNMRFKKRCYIHSISLTPEIFDPKKTHTPVKNGACITPIGYEPVSFTPKKTVCMQFSPEKLLDGGMENDAQRKELHDLLDDILNNPKEYEIKGDRKIIIRGIFEEVEVDGGVSKQNVGDLNLDYDNQKKFMVCYISQNVSGKQVKLSIEKEYLPMKYKKQFDDMFGEMNFVTDEDFIKFKKSIE